MNYFKEDMDIDKSRVKFIKYNLMIAAISILIICVVGILITKFYSYHEVMDYSDIIRIQYRQYLGEYKVIEYFESEEIKMISQKIQLIDRGDVFIDGKQSDRSVLRITPTMPRGCMHP